MTHDTAAPDQPSSDQVSTDQTGAPVIDVLTIETTPATPPERGALNISSNGAWTYEPEYKPGGLSVLGPVWFAYRVVDGKGGSAVGTVNITFCEFGGGVWARGAGGWPAGVWACPG